MELSVVYLLLALCCAVLLFYRRRLRPRAHRAEGTVARSESIANELDSKRRFLEAILDAIGDPIFVKDRDHRYIHVNQAKCRLNGYERAAIVGKTDYDFSPPEKEQVDIFLRRDNIVLETGREDINEEALTGADGVLRTVVTRKSLYVDDAGRRCVVGIQSQARHRQQRSPSSQDIMEFIWNSNAAPLVFLCRRRQLSNTRTLKRHKALAVGSDDAGDARDIHRRGWSFPLLPCHRLSWSLGQGAQGGTALAPRGKQARAMGSALEEVRQLNG
jgi:PAS domain S-box-containing protein